MSGELDFKGRTVIVTGSSKGIGRALANMFVSKGAKVVINGRRREPVEETVATLIAKGGDVVGNVGDVATENGGQAIVAQAIAQFGRLDIVVNNAGILTFAPFADMSTAVFHETMHANLDSAFHVTRSAWPYLARQSYGRILVFASQAIYGGRSTAHYGASKGALMGMMRSLSLEGRPLGIHVNAIIPFAYTDMTVNSSVSGTRNRFAEALARLQAPGSKAQDQNGNYGAAEKEMLNADLVAPAVGWLCHESCQTTGETVIAGGGRFARFLMTETAGYYNSQPSLESVRDNWLEICRESDCRRPNESVESALIALELMQQAKKQV